MRRPETACSWGNTNDAGNSSTSLTSGDTAGPTLALANTGARAPLNLVQKDPPSSNATSTGGDLANYGGDLYYAAGGTGGPFLGFVHTPFVANQLAPITPQRILDTRNANGRLNIATATGNLDAASRLLAGHTIVIKLGNLAGGAAAFCNLTAVSPLGAGYMTLWPGGTRPATSSINFTAGAIIANFAVTGINAGDTVSIYSAATTHVILDITAFAVGSPVQVSSAVLPAQTAARGGAAAHAASGILPK